MLTGNYQLLGQQIAVPLTDSIAHCLAGNRSAHTNKSLICRLVARTSRSAIRKWVSLEAAELYITTLNAAADVVPDPASGPALTRDPDDDYVVHLARAHRADFIVSSDADLLEWQGQHPLVIPPAEFEVRLSET